MTRPILALLVLYPFLRCMRKAPSFRQIDLVIRRA